MKNRKCYSSQLFFIFLRIRALTSESILKDSFIDNGLLIFPIVINVLIIEYLRILCVLKNSEKESYRVEYVELKWFK